MDNIVFELRYSRINNLKTIALTLNILKYKSGEVDYYFSNIGGFYT